ncbi:fimbrial protein [Escherichia coli]|uniref:F4 family fimbrial subunit n=1 Tax=Escherichia coli TaxID=562 RepID=UPI0012FD357D|nr:fimbrial protein [Escherichia coli]MVW21553.1 fimbrial protein [Escherichia coli]
MKKTLIALAVAASAVSGMAHAWTNGDFNGTIDFGGSIDATNYRQKWEWEVGTGLNGFGNTLSELTSDNTKLTITVTGNKPILLGRTKEAFSAPAEGVGAIPQIAFTDYKGTPVVLKNPAGEINKGLAYFDLPMKNADGTEVGSLRVNASYAGVSADSESMMYASIFATDMNHIFNGGMGKNVSGAEFSKGSDAAARTALFGSLSESELFEQIRKVNPGVGSFSDYGTAAAANMVTVDRSKVVSAAYALGIADGQTIEATFNQPVTTSTQWSAPLHVAVTYY